MNRREFNNALLMVVSMSVGPVTTAKVESLRYVKPTKFLDENTGMPYLGFILHDPEHDPVTLRMRCTYELCADLRSYIGKDLAVNEIGNIIIMETNAELEALGRPPFTDVEESLFRQTLETLTDNMS